MSDVLYERLHDAPDTLAVVQKYLQEKHEMLLGENLPWSDFVSQLTKLNYTTEITTNGVTRGYKIKIKKNTKTLN
jgi:hypothetical protein